MVEPVRRHPGFVQRKSAHTPTNLGSDEMIARRLGQAVMVIAIASTVVSTGPAEAREPSPIAVPGSWWGERPPKTLSKTNQCSHRAERSGTQFRGRRRWSRRRTDVGCYARLGLRPLNRRCR